MGTGTFSQKWYRPHFQVFYSLQHSSIKTSTYILLLLHPSISQCFREECTSSSCMTTIRPLVWFCFGYAFGNVLPSDGYLVNVYKVKAQHVSDKDYIILYIMLLLYFRRIVKKYFYLLIYFVSKVLDLMH